MTGRRSVRSRTSASSTERISRKPVSSWTPVCREHLSVPDGRPEHSRAEVRRQVGGPPPDADSMHRRQAGRTTPEGGPPPAGSPHVSGLPSPPIRRQELTDVGQHRIGIDLGDQGDVMGATGCGPAHLRGFRGRFRAKPGPHPPGRLALRVAAARSGTHQEGAGHPSRLSGRGPPPGDRRMLPDARGGCGSSVAESASSSSRPPAGRAGLQPRSGSVRTAQLTLELPHHGRRSVDRTDAAQRVHDLR